MPGGFFFYLSLFSRPSPSAIKHEDNKILIWEMYFEEGRFELLKKDENKIYHLWYKYLMCLELFYFGYRIYKKIVSWLNLICVIISEIFNRIRKKLL